MSKKFLGLLAVMPFLAMAMAAPVQRNEAEKSAQALADRCNHEVAETWEGLSRSIESLKDATQARALTNVFDLAAASTNRLAGIIGLLEKDQNRLSVITNDINQQPLELVDKQALRGYVESDLQTLQNAKQIAGQDRDVIADFLTHEKPRWTAMIGVLLRLYPEPQALGIMHERFSTAADDIRTAIESHRAMATAPARDEPKIERPIPARVSLPLAPKERPVVRKAVLPAAPAIIAPAREATINPPDIPDYAGFSDAARRALLMLSAGIQQSSVFDFIQNSGPFRLSSDHILALRSQGISERLIVAMLKRDRALRSND